MSLTVWFGQFNIVAGQVQEEGPFVGVFEGTQSAAGVGLYLVAEPVGSAGAQLCNEVIEVIARSFGRPEPVVTANLLRALAAGHQHVREWNRLHGDRPAGVGVSCLVVRGDEAYLAQCGPALALAHTAGRFRVAAPVGDDTRRPLGMGERAAPVFTRLTLHPGDVILLLFSAADRRIDRGALSKLACSPPEETMPELYLRVRDEPAFGALYLGILPAPEEAPAPQPAQGMGTDRPASTPPAPESTPRRLVARGNSRPGPRRSDTDTTGGMSGRRPAAVGRRTVDMGSLGSGRRLPSRRLLLLLAAIVALLLLLYFAGNALARLADDDRYTELLRSADGAVATARTQTDPTARRELLARAQSDLLEARRIRPQAVEVHQRLDAVTRALDALSSTRELSDVRQVADLDAAGVAAQSAIELATFAGRLYLLDAAGGKLLRLDPNGQDRPETVFEEARTIAGERTARPRHITVVPGTGSPGTLLVLDANRRLFALDADGSWRLLSLPRAETWKSDTAIVATAEALYVLDAAGDQVWRYAGSGRGYEGPPEPLLARGSLKEAIAISVAGSPVIATSSSRLLRLSEGQLAEWRPAGLDRPVVAPLPPLFNAADGQLYLADRGNERVVVLDTAGTFRAQLVHRRLAALRAIALDERAAVLYAVGGQSLIAAPLPR